MFQLKNIFDNTNVLLNADYIDFSVYFSAQHDEINMSRKSIIHSALVHSTSIMTKRMTEVLVLHMSSTL